MAKQIKASDLFDNEDIFKGVRESAELTIDVLSKVKAEFKQMADESKKSIASADLSNVKGLNEFITATEKANKLKKDTITIEEQEAKAKKNLIAIEREEEKLKREKLATAEKERKIAEQQIKASEKAAKQAQNEASAYKQLEANTRALKNQSKELAAQMLQMESAGMQSTAAYQKLSDEYTQVTLAAREGDKALKGIDKTVGDNFRNVGNYEGATQNLRKELKELTKTLQTMESTDPRFAEMSQRAGELKDQINDTNAVIKATTGSGVENMAGALANTGQIGVAAFQGVESAMALLGVESEAVMETMMRLQALAGLGDALKTLGGIGDTLTEIRAGFTAALTKMGLFTAATNAQTLATESQVLATEANTVATTAQAVATEGAAVASGVLGKAMKAIPFVAIAAAIGTAVYAMYEWLTVSDEEAKKAAEAKRLEEERQKAIEETNKETEKASEYIAEESQQFIGLIYQLKQTNAGSKEREKMIKSINAQYGTTLKNIQDETKFQEQLNLAVQDYITYQRRRYTLESNAEKFKAILKEQEKIGIRLKALGIDQLDIDKRKIGEAYAALSVDEQKQKLFDNYAKSVEEQQKGTDTYMGKTFITDEQRAKNFTKTMNSKEIKDGFALLKQYDKQLEVLAGSTIQTTSELSKYNYKNGESNKTTDKNTQSVKEYILVLDEVNEYLSTQSELLAKIDEFKYEKLVNAKQDEIDLLLSEDLRYARETGEVQVEALEQLIEEKYQLELEALKQKQAAAVRQLEIEYQLLGQKEREELEDSRIERLAQEGLTAEQKEQINKDYQDKLAEIENNNLQRAADLELEKQILTEETNKEILALDKTKNDEIIDANEQLYDAQVEYADATNKLAQDTAEKQIEIETARAETLKNIADQLTTYFIDQSNKKIEQIDKEIEAAENQYETLKTLAENGNINARESLAEQQRIINEANRKKEKELRRQQAIQMASAVYSTYNAKVLEGVENPLLETIKDTVLLQQFANTLLSQLPAFFDGTEDTGTNGRGVDGKGGFHAILHPNERVIPKSLNEQIGSMTNEQLATLAQNYNNGRLIGNTQNTSAFETAILVSKIDELNNTIKNKPETNIELGEITQSVMQIVKSTKQGNTIKTNRYKIRK